MKKYKNTIIYETKLFSQFLVELGKSIWKIFSCAHALWGGAAFALAAIVINRYFPGAVKGYLDKINLKSVANLQMKCNFFRLSNPEKHLFRCPVS